MKKFLVFATLFILCLAMGFSALATDVGGPIEKDTTWAKAGSPFIVKSNVTVVKDITLTIEPGVTVKFDKDKALLIDGKLVAQGTQSEKIIFTSNGGSYISFSDTSKDATFDPSGNYTGGCILQYADIQGGKSAVIITLSSPFIADSFVALNSGSGIIIDKGSPVIRNCEIKNNNNSGVSYSGDASSNPTIQKCIISENFAGYGGAIYIASGSITIQNSTISGNFANSYGGGIYLGSGSLTVESSTIIRNIASGGYGGGIYASGTLIVQNSTISENNTVVYGGGIYLYSGSLTVESSTISKNLASGYYYGSYGGGIYLYSGSFTVQNSTISENTTDYYGGGIFASGSLTVQNSTISGNFTNSSGGGIFLNSGSLTVESSKIIENSTKFNGGGIYASGILNTEGSTFTDNSAGSYGGAIWASGTVVIVNNRFNKECQGPGNNTAPYGGAIYASGAITMRRNKIIGNTASAKSGGIVRLDKVSGVIGGSPTDANHIENNAGDAVWISGNPAFNYNDVYGNYNEVYKTGYELINGSNSPIDATNCYWGTTDEAEIEAEIYHKPDNSSLGLVTYKPFSPTPFFDTIPPAAVTDLATSKPTATSITLTWTAPGDDGNVGTAAQYDIRYSMAEITEENWDAAMPCEGEPTPKPAGKPETFTVTNLSSCTTYYFALKTADDVSCWSPLSNVATGKTSGDTGAINGHVTDTVGNPLAKAIVIAIKEAAKVIAVTDKEGYFEIKDLQVGRWQVICIKKPYKAGVKKVDVKPCEPITIDFKLSPSAGDDEDEFTDLYANYPNPFNPDTWIPYSLSQDSDVTIRIFNSAGRLVRTLNLGRQVAGIHITKDEAAYWDGKDDLGQRVASGVYYYTLQAGEFRSTRKMVIMK